MQKITFQDGTKISSAKVTIDGVDYLVTPSYYEGATPLSSLILNQMQTNIENEVTVEKQTQVAEEFEISDSAGVQGSINIVNGKTLQGSNPSPDSPQEIKNVGSNLTHNINIKIKNGTDSSAAGYKEETITFPLAQGQVLHNGDYLAKDGIHSNRKTIIFDGTEDWKIYDTIFHLAEIDDYSPSNNIPNCTHLKGLSNKDGISTMKQQDDNTIAFYNENTSSSIKRVYIKLTSITTLADFKQWVTDQYTLGNPVTLEYDLKEETITPYTADQLQALDKLLNAEMYQEKTYIDCLDEVKPDLQVQYLYDNDINNYYGKRLDEVEITVNNKLDADLVDDTTSTNKFVTASDKTTWNSKVGTTDYATSSKGGVIVIGSNAVGIDNYTGKLMCEERTYSNYSSAGNNIFISKGTLENAITGKSLLNSSSLKTVNSTSLVGSGDIAVQPTLVSGTNIKTINNESLLGSGNITIQGGGSSITVHDSYNTSTTEPYSCNYINTVVGNIETLLSQI